MHPNTPSQRPLHDAILLTGGGQRLGLYHAERMLDLGWPLIVSYRTPRPSIDALVARGARAIQADLSHAAGIEAFIAAIQREASSLRAIIHNASLWLDDAHVAAHPEGFEAMMQLHVHAPYRINLACEALLRASSYALTDIIHISDSRVARGSAQRAAYMASKAALDNLTLSFAARFAPHTKVNTIAPGLILFNEGDDAAYRQRRLSESALGFEPGAQVVWQAIQFILDNRYLTGATIALDGGINIK
jgi:dihydromonapterin reductase/dihydrofolate reductase